MGPAWRTSEQAYDEWLVLRTQDGESAALGELVRRWHARLVGFAMGLTRGEDEARDAVQDAWVAAARGIGRLDDPARFPAWVCRIVVNKCADRARRAERDRRVERERAQDEPRGFVNQSSPEDDSDETERVRAGLRRLGPAQREVLGLHYAAGLGTAEIAEVMGVPAGTVKSRLHAARAELRSMLERMRDEPP